MTKKSSGRAVVPAEELASTVDELMALARERGLKIRRANVGVSYTIPSSMPQVDEQFRDSLRIALEDEIVPAKPLDEDHGLLELDVHREVVKKALVGLKLPTLRKLAKQHRLAAGGTIEALVTRLAREYEWDEEAIARLILANEAEPRPEHAHLDRLYPLEEPVELASVERALSKVAGRYIRTGVARWFVFDSVERVAESTLRLKGSVRSYQAFVVGEQGEEARLDSRASIDAAEVWIRDRVRTIRVRRGSTRTGTDAVRAIKAAARTNPLGYVPMWKRFKTGAAADLAPQSVFLLDLVYTRLRALSFRQINLTVARFRLADDTATTDVAKPSLHAVRFEGSHLLDSAAACKLLVEEGRPLVDVSMHVLVSAPEDTMWSPDSPPGGAMARFPIRVTLEADHVSVTTGYGSDIPEWSAQIHTSVLNAASDEIWNGVEDSDALESLSAKMKERAKSVGAADTADMLADDE